MPLITKHREDILSKEEVADMLDRSDNLRDQALIAVFYILGCRVSEALALKKEDIILNSDDTVSFRLVALKREERSVVPFKHTITINYDSSFMKYILDYLEILDKDQKLFQISRSQVWRIITKLNGKAWCHLFRHTRLTKLAEKGANSYQLQVWAGWRSEKSAKTYVHKSDRMILDLADKVD